MLKSCSCVASAKIGIKIEPYVRLDRPIGADNEPHNGENQAIMTHSFSDDDLLAYTRGEAPEELARRIESEISQNRDLEAEIALLGALKPALAADAINPPGELGWRRLEAEIQREQVPHQNVDSSSALRMWKVASVLLGLGVLGQAAYIVSMDNQPAYNTASAVDEDHVVGLAFEPEASVSDISTLLGEVEARIVDGPGALGLYRVAFDTEKKLRSGREQLRASDLVILVADE